LLDPAQTRGVRRRETSDIGGNRGGYKLAASFGRCMAPGNQAQFSKTVLQGALAEALYKRSAAQRRGPNWRK
jgi:hypothetical protein